MRLTLRTLLAYIDDTLDAPTARDIGQKVEESDYAQDLVERIRRVIRTRRLSAPRPLSETVDANVVAEYLDNVLEKELVARFEADCLRSDRELAEVAACHQILTMLGQPAHVGEETKQRLLRLVLEQLDLKEAADRLPLGQKPISLQQPRLLPWVVAALMLLAAVAFVGKVTLDRYQATAKRPPAATADGDRPEVPPEQQPPQARGADQPGKSQEARGQAPAAERPASTDRSASEAETTPEPAAERPTAEPEPTPAPDKPPTTEPTVPEARPEAEPAEPTARPEPVAPKPPKSPVLVAGSTHIAAVYEPSVGDWVAVATEMAFRPMTPMVNFDGVRTRVVVRPWVADAVDLTGWVWGAPVNLRDAPATPTLDLEFGQLLLRPQEAPARLLITSPAGPAFLIEAQSTDTRVAVKFQPVYVPGGPHSLEATFVPLSGVLNLTVVELVFPEPEEDAQQADGAENQAKKKTATTGANTQRMPDYVPKETVQLQPGKDIVYRSDRGQITLRERAGEAEPEWITGRSLPVAQRRSLRQFLRQLPTEGRLPPRLLEILHDGSQDDNVRALALRTLVALGRLQPVIRLLNSSDSVFLRLEAIRWLRWYLALGPAEYAHLAESVYRVFVGRPPEGEKEKRGLLEELQVSRAGAVVLLLNGVPEGAERERELYAALIELLRPEVDLAVRQLAILTLKELTGEDHGYNPDLPQERSIQAWLRDLERGVLPPRRIRRR